MTTFFPNHPEFYETAADWVKQGRAFAVITLLETGGSVPQNSGAKMLLSREGERAGTIGGGRLEARAMEEALEYLEKGDPQSPRLLEWDLDGMRMECGGSARLFLEWFFPSSWEIALFGAGHVAQALCRLLMTLACRVTIFDTRTEWLDQLPLSASLCPAPVAGFAEGTERLTEQTFAVVLTPDHSEDAAVLEALLKREEKEGITFPYLGCIGSAKKAAALQEKLKGQGLSPARVDAIHSPIGLPLGGKAPAEIALSIAAQLLQERDRVQNNRHE